MKGILFKPWKIKFIAEHPDMDLQTRRVIKPQPSGDITLLDNGFAYEDTPSGRKRIMLKPPYQVGETVYIKEAFMIEQSDGFDEPTDRPFKNDYEWGLLIPHYKLTDPDPELYDEEGKRVKWLSPLFMPEWAARYFLVITDVRAERLQEISDDDCLAEGITKSSWEYNIAPYRSYIHKGVNAGRSIPTAAFMDLWNSINKEKWESNPWVFIYTFRMTEIR